MISGDHLENRNAFPFEELLKYEGQHVAWSADGKRILASDEDPLKLVAKLKEAGHTSEEYVLSWVDFDTYLGGVIVTDGERERI